MEETLTDVARRVDETVAAARAELVQAVRSAAAEGMTQVEIAAAIGRSQPEVSRLLHFHGSSPHGVALRRQAREVRREIERAGGCNIRVFGSVATGNDSPDSDIDLLFDSPEPLGLMTVSKLEQRLAKMLGLKVDLIPSESLRPDLRDEVLRTAVPL